MVVAKILERFKQLGKFTKTFIILGLVLILYGYTCRLLGIYFFWESKLIGWTILLFGIIGFLVHNKKEKTNNNKRTIFEKVAIGIISLILLVETIMLLVIPRLHIYSIAENYVKNDNKIGNEIGTIKELTFLPKGGIQTTVDTNGEYGVAEINFIVKGNKKYKDITVFVVKYIDSTEWKVVDAKN